jgi:hypothetical protein
MNSNFRRPVTSYNVAIFLATIVALAIVVNAAPVLVNRHGGECDCNVALGHSCTPNPGPKSGCNQFLYFAAYLGM